MRMGVLPRAVAARVITGSVATVGWAVGTATILFTFPVLIETLARRDRLADLLLPLLMLIVVLAGIAAVVRWRRRRVVVIYLVVAGSATFVYETALLRSDPALITDGLYLLNRPNIALVVVGVAATTAITGILWSLLGYLVANAVILAVTISTGVEYRPGFGPTMVFAISVIAYLTLAGIQTSQRRRVPDFDRLEAETQRWSRGEDLSRHTTAAVHDTLLNDLSIVMTSSGELDERASERLLEDLEVLRGAEWISHTRDIRTVDVEDATLRNELMRMVSDFQWRGLSIHVTGTGSGIYRLSPSVAAAAVGAIRAAFENALRHSGAAMAELEVIYSAESATIMITDHGSGFDMSAIPADRLGVRGSIIERLQLVGGSAQIWSAPGEGTSIIMTLPVAEVVVPQEESHHQEMS
ncbi:MAG TPA: ATP-binding protein [Pseudolysinimonas sp.]|nr:ATP-binding protein [Pseudolysinimonas sp.]